MSLLSASDVASINRFMQTRRDRAATRNAYKAALRDFLRFVRAHADDDLVSTHVLRLWLKSAVRQTTRKTVRTYARHVERFLQWRQERGEIPCNPFSELRRCYELRAVGPIVDALLMTDYRSALEKLRPATAFGSVLGPQMQAHVALKRPWVIATGAKRRSSCGSTGFCKCEQTSRASPCTNSLRRGVNRRGVSRLH